MNYEAATQTSPGREQLADASRPPVDEADGANTEENKTNREDFQ